MRSNFDEQPSLNFDSIGYVPEENFYPPSTSRIFLNRVIVGNAGKLLSFMRGLVVRFHKKEIDIGETYQTKVQLAEMLYPEFYDPRKQSQKPQFLSDGHSQYSVTQILHDKHKETVTRAIHRIDYRIRKQLRDLKSESEKIHFLINNVELLIRVEKTDKNEAIYAYHSSDFPQPVEALEFYHEWAIEHQDQQSKTMNLAKLLHCAATNPRQLKLNIDTNDFEDADMNDSEENF